MAVVIPLQTEFRPVLPTIRGNVDYESFQTDLLRMDQILVLSGVEDLFVQLSLERWRAESGQRVPTPKEQCKFQGQSAQALRCIVLQQLLVSGGVKAGESWRFEIPFSSRPFSSSPSP